MNELTVMNNLIYSGFISIIFIIQTKQLFRITILPSQ